MTGSNRLLLRRLALALAAAQLAAFALAPVIEAASEHEPGPASIEAAHGHCVKVHQPATCLACVLAATRGRAPERVRLVLTEAESRVRERPVPTAAPSRAPPRVLRTRAPPPLAA